MSSRFDDIPQEYYDLFETDYDAWYKKYVEPEVEQYTKGTQSLDERLENIKEEIKKAAAIINDRK